MQKLLASIVCFSLCAVMATAQGDKGKGLLLIDRGPGSWHAVSAIVSGKKLPDDIIAKVNMILVLREGHSCLTTAGTGAEFGTYTIDAKKQPAQIDFVALTGKDKGKTQLGLVKADGDAMTLAFGKMGSKDRPKDFEGGEGFEVTVFKRK